MTKRVETLISYEVGSAAVALANIVSESSQCKELLSRIFLAIATDEKHRGRLVQQGGGKVSARICVSVMMLRSAVVERRISLSPSMLL